MLRRADAPDGMAKAVAGECGVPFVEQNGGNVMGKFLGESADGIKKLFSRARAFAREYGGCIIFIDEIDAIASSRNNQAAITHDEKINALNTLLAEMDGFGDNTGIVVMGATNRLEILDPAILRPGRFDRKIFVPLPGKLARQQILSVYLSKIPLDVDVELDRLATMSPQFSGADLAHWVNEAAVQAACCARERVTMADFFRARDIILAGPQNTGLSLTPEEESAIAWHEAGHAEVRHATGGFVDRVSILPRGQALGITFSVPEDTNLHTKEQLHQELQVLLAGRAAEELFVHQISSGAANDLERASQIAFDAVVRLGLGDRGLFVPQTDSGRHESEASAARLIESAYADAKEILRASAHRVARLHDLLLRDKEVDYRQLLHDSVAESTEDGRRA
ncbi:MAG: AAA family ATPase [Acidithiobacillus caldus]|nr:AAA family ATPase [Acidithiobacillus caldus]